MQEEEGEGEEEEGEEEEDEEGEGEGEEEGDSALKQGCQCRKIFFGIKKGQYFNDYKYQSFILFSFFLSFVLSLNSIDIKVYQNTQYSI